MNTITLSVVIPVYNEEKNVPELYARLDAVRKTRPGKTEIIFVNDGSTDGSRQALEAIAAADTGVTVVNLNKNYGQTIALGAGIKNSTGKIIVTMDADLQNDPADIPALLAALDGGYDVVSGWRKDRKDPYLTKILPSRIANFLIAALTRVKIHDFGCTLKAYKREFIEDLPLYGEMHRFLAAYCSWNGARITEVPVNHRPRIHGVSKYGLSRTFKVVLDLLVVKFVLSYFTKPMYVFGGAAAIAFLSGAGVNVFVVVRRLYGHGEWLSPLFFAGLLLWAVALLCFFLGLLAELLVRLYFGTRQYQFYKVHSTVNGTRQ